MRVSVEDAGASRKLVRIDVPAEALAAEFEQVITAFRKAARPAGFRPGKAPLSVIESRYAKEIVEEVKERAVPKFYHAALEQEKLEPVATVGVANVELVRDRGLKFDVTIDVAPEFKLPKYRGLTLKTQSVEVTDAQVDGQFERLLDSAAVYRDVTDRPVGKGDMVMVDYAGTVNGGPVSAVAPAYQALGQGENFWALVDEPAFLPGWVEGLVGAVLNERRQVSVPFPADYRIAPLAGKTAVYEVLVKALRAKVPPVLDEAFFKRFDVDSETALRARIREELDRAARQRERAMLGEQAARFLLENTDLELPESIVDREIRLTTSDMVRRIAARGATREQIEQHRDTILDEATKTSRDRVKLGYILTRIATEEKIQVEEREIDARLEALAGRSGMSPGQFRAEMEKRNAMEGLRSEVRNEKTIEFVIAEATLKN